MKKKRLKKLAKYLEKHITDDDFDMNTFRVSAMDGFNVNFESKDNCGSVGCALGWSPFVKGLEPIESDFRFTDLVPSLDFVKYSDRVFELDDNEWRFLFEQDWEVYDNTVEGAVDRIRYLVKHGLEGLDGYMSKMGNYAILESDVDIYSRN